VELRGSVFLASGISLKQRGQAMTADELSTPSSLDNLKINQPPMNTHTIRIISQMTGFIHAFVEHSLFPFTKSAQND
jgi:hypothetical protein